MAIVSVQVKQNHKGWMNINI